MKALLVDVKLALFAIIPVATWLWFTRIQSGDTIGNVAIGCIVGLALYGILRLIDISKRG